MKKIFVILTSVATLFSASCAKQLEVTPQNSVYDEQIMDLLENGSDDDKQLVLNAIAAPMVKYFNFWGSPMPGGGLAPMEYCYQGIEEARSLHGNDMCLGTSRASTNSLAGTAYYDGTSDFTSYSTASNSAHWLGYAYGINKANQCLSYMTKELAEKDEKAAAGRAGALCVRAYSYMELMEEYCQPYTGAGKDKLGMSLYTVYDPAQEPVARSTAKETWDFIIADLKEADALTSSNITVGYANLEDFDNSVVSYLLARAYILTGDWNNAIAACDKIINSGKYSFIKDENYGCNPTGAAITSETVKFLPQNNAFTALQKNPECILGFIRTSSYNPEGSAGYSTLLQNPFGTYSQGGSTVRMDDVLYSQIADDDVRKNAFYPQAFKHTFATVGTIEIPSFAAMKYGATHGLENTGDAENTEAYVNKQEFCKFRLSEVYLMKAEAETYTGGDYKSTLNKLISARTQGKLTCDTYPSMVNLTPLGKVQLQYRIEMWGENGREYFNNKRWGIDINRKNSNVHWAKDVDTKASEMTCEIPLNEQENNPELVLD